jgi:hypothetical protein
MNTDNMGKNYDGTYSITGKTLTKEDGVTISLDIKGSAPEEGTVTITNSVVTLANIKFGKYYVTYTYENKETSYCSSKKGYPTSCDSSTDNSSSDNTTGQEEQAITLNVGDYVQMTPTEKEYTIAADDTGCPTDKSKCNSQSDQTINPSELTLWKVIRVNDDNTYDAVSVYTSSTKVYFYGQTGYLNFIGTLNKIAKQYENSNYTTGSRMMGYNGQTENLKSSDVQFTNPASLTKSTSDNTNESVGGGDILYQTDYDLVQSAFNGSVYGFDVETKTAMSYWLASRWYYYNNSTSYGWLLRQQDEEGVTRDNAMIRFTSSGWQVLGIGRGVRPIITLKSELYASGTGTETDPYILHQKS